MIISKYIKLFKKSNIKSIIFWSLGISLLIFGVISKMSVIQDQGVNIDELMAGFPKILMVLFGFSSVPLDNPEGIFVITMTYIVIGLLIKWFLNTSAIHKKKFISNGTKISGICLCNF